MLPRGYDLCACGAKKRKTSRTCRPCRYPATDHKECTICGRTLPLSAFRIRTRKIPKPRSHCKECESSREMARYYKKPVETRKSATRIWEKRNPDKLRRQQLRRRCRQAGVPLSAIEEMVVMLLTNPACSICGRSPSEVGREHHLDHDHVSGKFRGILCEPCNMGLGKFAEDPARLLAAVRYLQRRLPRKESQPSLSRAFGAEAGNQ